MKLVILMNHFDENPDWLYESVKSCGPLPVTDLISCDGPYELYPDSRDESPSRNYDALHDACSELGIRLFHHAVGRRSEVWKRAFMFEKAMDITTKKDWLMVLDADERVDSVGHFRLEGDAATSKLWDPTEQDDTVDLRMFFRALRGLTVQNNHYTFIAGGKVLWGTHGLEEVPAIDSGVSLKHLTHLRAEKRRNASLEYYKLRDEAGIETFPCYRCGELDIQPRIPFGWYRDGDGIRAHYVGVCSGCFESAWAESEAQLARLMGVPKINLAMPGVK